MEDAVKNTTKKTGETNDTKLWGLPLRLAVFIAGALIIAALALCLSCIGKTLPLPLQDSKTWNNASVVATNTDTSDQYSNFAYAVVDDNYKTLNILTKDWTLYTQNAITGTKFKTDKIVAAAIDGQNVYLSVVNWSVDKNKIENEYLIRTNVYGEAQEVIYTAQNNQTTNYADKEIFEDSASKTPKISDIKIQDDKLIFCEINYNTVTVKQIDLDGEQGGVQGGVQGGQHGNATSQPQTISTYVSPNYLVLATYSPDCNAVGAMDFQNIVYKGESVTEPAREVTEPAREVTESTQESTQQKPIVQLGMSDGYTTNINLLPDNKMLVLRYGANPVQILENGSISDINPQTNTVEVINHTDQSSFNWGEVLLDGSGRVVAVGKTVPIGWFYNLKINARWAAIVILILAVIWALIVLIRSQMKLIRKGLFKDVTVAVLIGITALAICTLYSVYIYNDAIQTCKTQVNQQANIACDSLTPQQQNSFQDILATNYVGGETQINKERQANAFNSAETIHSIASSLVNEFSKDGNIYLYSCYANEPSSGDFYCIADSEKACQGSLDSGTVVRGENENKTIEELLQSNIDALRDNQSLDFENYDNHGLSYCSIRAVVNDAKEIAGIMMFFAYADTTVEVVLQNIGMLGIIVLISYLLFLVAYLEIKRLMISIRGYRRDSQGIVDMEILSTKNPEEKSEYEKFKTKIAKQISKRSFVNLVRPMNFFIALAFGADSALAVLVSKKLFDSSSFAADATAAGLQDFMYGLPITLTCAGLVVGILAFISLQKRVCIRTIFVGCSVLYCLAFVMSTVACYSNMYVVFVFSKFLIGFFCGCMKAELYTFTTLKDIENDRKTLLRDISRSTMPAVVISTLLCGYLTTIVDYYVLYLFAAICSIVVVIFGVIFVPRKVLLCNDGTKSSLVRNVAFFSQSKILRWIFSPKVLMVVLFVIVPCAITKGYKSYLFPLYSNAVGVDKVTISVIFSMATMVSFLLVHVISDFNNRFKDSRKVINALFILGFVFVLFRANSRIEWAIVAMFLTTIFGRTFGSAFRLGLTRMCEHDGLGKEQIQPYIYLIEEVCNAMQVVLCGLLTTVGGKYACAVFGLYCFASAIIFAITVKKTHFDSTL